MGDWISAKIRVLQDRTGGPQNTISLSWIVKEVWLDVNELTYTYIRYF